MNTPSELKYTKEHEWVKIEGNIATIGITDFAQGELGDIVFVDVDSVDDDLAAGDVFGSVEAVKTVSDLFLPISGKVAEFNESLEDEPELLNSDPYGKGWIIKVEIADGADLSELLICSLNQEQKTTNIGSCLVELINYYIFLYLLF